MHFILDREAAGCRDRAMLKSLPSALLVSAVVASLLAGDGRADEIDLDPLRRYLPRGDIYMQVPGALLAVEETAAEAETVEERAYGRHGGLVVGYCLRSSCTWVTHLVVLQVCSNRVGGPKDAEELVLGVIKLPYGDMPGQLVTLQGRNYIENVQRNGPYTQALDGTFRPDDSSLYALWANGAGPVAPMAYLGLAIDRKQSTHTLALQMGIARNQRTGWRVPRLEVRHLCERPMS